MNKEEVFIKLESKYTTVLNKNVYLKDVGQIFCKNSNIQKFLEQLKIFNAQDKEINDFLTSVDIVNKIQRKKENLEITMLGEPEVLIEFKEQEKRNMLYEYFRVFLVCSILFFGAGLAIVNFHEDVDIKKTMSKIYYLITGNRVDNPLILVISYSIGIGLGIIAFFEKRLNKRNKDEPGPLEVEAYLYDKDVDDFVLNQKKNIN